MSKLSTLEQTRSRRIKEDPVITAMEHRILRDGFEAMMMAAPFHFRNFTRSEDGEGYANTMLTVAWHTLKCGYMAGVSHNRVG